MAGANYAGIKQELSLSDHEGDQVDKTNMERDMLPPGTIWDDWSVQNGDGVTSGAGDESLRESEQTVEGAEGFLNTTEGGGRDETVTNEVSSQTSETCLAQFNDEDQLAHELTNKLVIAADKLRVAQQAAAKEKYLLYSNSNKAMLDKKKSILKLRTELAVEEAELVVCQTRAMDAQEAHRAKDAEVAKWSAIVRLKHLELMELGRRSTFKCSDTRLEAKMMAEECLLEEEAVRADLIREEERKAMELRRKAEEEQKEAEKLRKATEEEKLRKAEAVKKEKEAEDARRKAVAASEARQRQLLESNLKKQLNNIQLQNLGVASQPSGVTDLRTNAVVFGDEA